MIPEISASKPITPAQIRAVKTRLRRLAMADSEYRQLLMVRWGVASCTALTRREASHLLSVLGQPLARAPGEQPPRPPRPPPAPTPPGVTPLPTPEQQRLIGELASEIEWSQPGGYAGWLKHSQGLDRVATREQARRVIEGLLAIQRRRRAAT